MNAKSMRGIMLAILFSLTLVVWAAPAAKKQTGWRTYRSPDYGFSIDYPRSMTFSPGHPVEAPQLSMFAICDDGTVACFQYNGKAFEGTTTQAAGVSVNVLRELNTQSSCNTIDDVSVSIKTIRIHGTLFHFGESDDGGAGSSRGITEYRTFYKHVCFEVAVVIAVTDAAPGHEEDEGYHPLNRRAWRRISNNMDKMLHSFTFVGPVKDGPDWNVYYDGGCGGSFEYPSSSTLQKVVEYSNQAFNASWITCEQAFIYKNREYTVAVKVNLKDDDAVDEWLSYSGYPGLEQMKVVLKDDDFTQYSDQTYTYLCFQNDLFIFTVAGAHHKPISSEGDVVFSHLLESFRVR